MFSYSPRVVRYISINKRGVQTRKYQDEKGNNRYITEIVADEIKFLSKPKNNSEGNVSQSDTGFIPVEGDDIPF